MTRPKLLTSEGHMTWCPSEERDADEIYMLLYDDSVDDEHALADEYVWTCHDECIARNAMSDEIGTYYTRVRRYRNRTYR